MRILITGCTGFIGKNLFDYLTKYESGVYGTTRKKSNNKKIFTLDLSNPGKIKSVLERNNFDVVIHLAAEIESSEPIIAFNTNCKNTFNLLKFCALTGVSKVIFASTHLVYGNSQYLPIDEKHPINPISNYAVSKLIAENICKLFSNVNDLQTIVFRLSSVVGFGQNERFVIPKLLHNVNNNNNIILHKYKNGFQLMDSIRIDDVCNAFYQACKLKTKSDVYNIASGKPITVDDLTRSILKISDDKIITKMIRKKTNHFFYDITKLKKTFKFTPKPITEEFLSSWMKKLS